MEEKLLAQDILKKRTQLLAKRKAEKESFEDGLELIIFAVGDERYGLEAKQLKGIRPASNSIPLPGVPSFITGITNLFGVLYSVIDLKTFLGLKSGKKVIAPQLLIIDHDELKIAFLVDQIIEFKTILERNLETNITGIKSLDEGLIKGISEEAIVVLNLEKILEKIRKFGK